MERKPFDHRVNNKHLLRNFLNLSVFVTILCSVFCAQASAAACMNIPSADRASWDFDELSGSVVLDSSGSNHGSLVNQPIRTTSKFLGGLDFNGSHEYVSVPDHPSLDFGAGDFTIEAWIRTADTSGTIVSKRVNYGRGHYVGYVFMINDGRLLVQLSDAANSEQNYLSSSSSVVNDMQWHHVAVAIDRSSSVGGKVYLDGVNILTFNPKRTGDISNSSALTIGKTSDGFDYFDGQIDDVSLYGKALSSSEIASIFTARADGKCDSDSNSRSSLTVTLHCLVGSGMANCLSDTEGGVGTYTHHWSYQGGGTLVPNQLSATVLNCTNGVVTVVVYDALTSASASKRISC